MLTKTCPHNNIENNMCPDICKDCGEDIKLSDLEERLEYHLSYALETEEDLSIAVNSMYILIKSEIEKAKQEVIDKITKIYERRLQYCLDQNGLNYCKNCGLRIKDLSTL